MIPEQLRRLFPVAVRSRGEQYFLDERVQLVQVTPERVRAQVRGTADYGVALELGGPASPALECSCPYAHDHGVCKHQWAVLLALNKRGAFDRSSGALRPVPGIASDIDDWRQRLKQLRRHAGDPDSAPQDAIEPLGQPLGYRLDFDHLQVSAEVMIQVVMGDGSHARFSDEQWLRSADPVDRDLAHRLLGALLPGRNMGAATSTRQFVIPPAMYDTTLRDICGTGRCILLSRKLAVPAGPVVWDDGGTWGVRFALAEETPDTVTLRGWFTRNGTEVAIEDAVLVTQPGLLVIGTRLCRVTLGDAWPLVWTLRTGGPLDVPADHVFELAAELTLLPGEPLVELPDSAEIEHVSPEPLPRLHVKSRASHGFDTALVAHLSFSYDGTVVKASNSARPFVDRTHRRIVHRDPERERELRARLLDAGATTRQDWRSGKRDIVIPVRRLHDVVVALALEGWRVEADDRLYRTATHTEARVSSGIDWFELQGDVSFGEQHARLPELLAALNRGERTIRLDDGSTGILPAEWLRRYTGIAALASTESDTTLRFGRGQAALLDALLAEQPEVRIDETFARLRDELHAFDAIEPQDAPPGFHGELRSYQKEALGWMAFLRRLHFGGCLADDMGLGKTVQVLALLEQRRQDGAGPSLVVVPKSLVFNWIAEATRFTPGLRVRDYSGAERRREPLDPGGFDLLVSTYGTLRRDAPELRDIEFDYLILDEAQAIKNATTASAKAARLLRGRHRLALSGTPIENSLSELWSLFDFLNPGLLGSARSFAALRNGTRGTALDDDSRAMLARALRPFLLRRTKAQVAPELPPRIEQTLVVELETDQRALYDSLRDHYRAELLDKVDGAGFRRSKIQILEALLRLRQAACHPGLIDPKHADADSAKLSLLLETLEEVIAEGHRALVFSQFTSFLALVRERLDAAGIAYEYLDGRTRDRQARVERFQSSTTPVFLISLRAGGQGLNLTAADYAFLLDPWWNPAVEAQAIDRTHRIGQTRPVIAMRLIARDTVEEKVIELQRTKRELADAILGADAGLIASITREDLELLLE